MKIKSVLILFLVIGVDVQAMLAPQSGLIPVAFARLTKEQQREYELCLCDAARHGNLENVKMLIEGGVNVDVFNDFNWTALHLAVFYGHLDVVQFLVENEINQADLNVRITMGWTPLHAAAHNGHFEIVICLVNHGAPVHAWDQSDYIAEQVARNNGHSVIANYLQQSRSRPRTA